MHCFRKLPPSVSSGGALWCPATRSAENPGVVAPRKAIPGTGRTGRSSMRATARHEPATFPPVPCLGFAVRSTNTDVFEVWFGNSATSAIDCALRSWNRVGPTGKKGGLETAITAEITAEAARLIGDGVLDGLDFEARDPAAACGDGGRDERHLCQSQRPRRAVAMRLRSPARYAGRHPKTFSTALGTVTLERAYYHCGRCGRGVFPRERVDHGRYFAVVRPMRMTGLVAAEVSFAVQRDEMSWPGCGSQAGRARRRGAGDRDRRRAPPPRCRGPVRSDSVSSWTAPACRCAPKNGRDRPASSRTTSKTREVKLVTVWTERHAMPSMRDPGSTSYAAAIESAAAAIPTRSVRLQRRGSTARSTAPPRCREPGDLHGAPWLVPMNCSLTIQTISFMPRSVCGRLPRPSRRRIGPRCRWGASCDALEADRI